MKNLKTVKSLLDYLSVFDFVNEDIVDKETKIYSSNYLQGIIYALKIEENSFDKFYHIHENAKNCYGQIFSFVITYNDDYFNCDEIDFDDNVDIRPEPTIADLFKTIIQKFPQFRKIEADFANSFDDFSIQLESLNYCKDELVNKIIELRVDLKILKKEYQILINENSSLESKLKYAERDSKNFEDKFQKFILIAKNYLPRDQTFKKSNKLFKKIINHYHTNKENYHSVDVIFLYDANKVILKIYELEWHMEIGPYAESFFYLTFDSKDDTILNCGKNFEASDINFILSFDEFEQIFK